MLRRLVSLFTTPGRRRRSRAGRPARPALRLEALEDRSLPAPLFTGVPVSDVGPGTNHIAGANSSRNVAVAPNGTIYVEFYGANGIRVAHSTNRGHSFSPSVQVTKAISEGDLVVGANGVVYVAWVEGTMAGNEAMISRSTNGGATFSAPAVVGLVNAKAVHLAVQSHYVYLVPDHGGSDTGRIVFVNSNGGVGAFTTTTVDTFDTFDHGGHVRPRSSSAVRSRRARVPLFAPRSGGRGAFREGSQPAPRCSW